MQRLKNVLISALHVLVIALILAFILFGLWRIGLIEPPAFAARLFGLSTDNPSDSPDSATEFLKPEDAFGDYTVLRAELSAETVRDMLENLTPAESYMQDLQYTLFSSHGSVSQRIVISRNAGTSTAYYISSGARATRQVIERDGTLTVNTTVGNNLRSVSYPSAAVGFDEQIGVIRTHKDFLATADDTAYTYSLLSGEDGTVMLISFTSQLGSLTQEQTYYLNLDYGVVTSADCYENGEPVYSLSTNAISRNPTVNLDIPAVFEQALAADGE